MREPDYATTVEFMQWARENKRRADRLLKAAKEISTQHSHDFVRDVDRELRMAATDYEDMRG